MSIETPVKKSSAYIVSQCREHFERMAAAPRRALAPAITIAHLSGTGAHEIAGRLAQALQQAEFKGDSPWAVFDQRLIEEALEEQHWPVKLAEKITEERRFFIDDLVDDLFGLRPPSWILVPQVVETTLRLATAGHAILVGHGATAVTVNLANVFHVRLTGSLPKRVERVQMLRNLTSETAARIVRKEDHDRERYVKTHFHARLDNELLYDLLINTDRVAQDDAVAMIVEGARRFFSAR